jgi:hypothetical protein
MSALWSVDLSLCCRCPTASLLLMPSILCPRVILCACYLFPLCNVYVCRSGYCESVLPCWCGWNQVTHTNGTHCSIILIFALLSGWATCFAYHLLIIFIHYYNYLSLYFSVSPKCDSLFVYPEPHVILVHCPITSPLFAVANCWWFACDWCVWRSLPLMWADLFFFWPYMARYGICCACVRFRLIWDDLVLIYCIAQLRSLFFSFCPPRLMVRLWLVCVEIPTLMVGRSIFLLAIYGPIRYLLCLCSFPSYLGWPHVDLVHCPITFPFFCRLHLLMVRLWLVCVKIPTLDVGGSILLLAIYGPIWYVVPVFVGPYSALSGMRHSDYVVQTVLSGIYCSTKVWHCYCMLRLFFYKCKYDLLRFIFDFESYKILVLTSERFGYKRSYHYHYVVLTSAIVLHYPGRSDWPIRNWQRSVCVFAGSLGFYCHDADISLVSCRRYFYAGVWKLSICGI